MRQCRGNLALLILIGALFAASSCGSGDSGAVDQPDSIDELTSTIDEAGAGVQSSADELSAESVTPGADELASGSSAEVSKTDSGDEGFDAPEISPCALVSAEEIAEITGVAVELGEPYVEDYGVYTTFSCDSDDIHIGVDAYPDVATATEAFEFLWEPADDGTVIEGLGDRAYNTAPLGDIAVLSGRYHVGVDLFVEVGDSGRGDAERDAATDIARSVLGQLTE